MVFHDSENLRKSALALFRAYFHKFSPEAQYPLIFRLYDTSNHSGLIALITSLAKNALTFALDDHPTYKRHFLGSKFPKLLARICHLPNGKFSEPIEISDELLASLNTLLYLTLRDKTNQSGFWDHRDMVEDKFLDPLREARDGLIMEYFREQNLPKVISEKLEQIC